MGEFLDDRLRELRSRVFFGAVLAILHDHHASAAQVGRILYGGGQVATGRALGGMLAMRTMGLIDAKTLGPRSIFHVTTKGREWLRDVLAIKEEG